jgi:hypothetical protein
VKDGPSYRLKRRENVTCRGCILSSHSSSSKLTGWRKQIDIVRTAKVLSEPDDSLLQRNFAMMVRRMFGNVSCQLGDFNLILEVALEAGVQNFALRRLETINNMRDGTLVVVMRKLHELFVDELRVFDSATLTCLDVVHEAIFRRMVQPELAILDALFAEHHVD